MFLTLFKNMKACFLIILTTAGMAVRVKAEFLSILVRNYQQAVEQAEEFANALCSSVHANCSTCAWNAARQHIHNINQAWTQIENHPKYEAEHERYAAALSYCRMRWRAAQARLTNCAGRHGKK
jgi:hypothetical protein